MVWAGKEPTAAVSLSWGSPLPFPGADGLYFNGAANRTVVVAASGDQGGMVYYPAESPATFPVGGTSLVIDPVTWSYVGETAWAQSGGGPSPFYPGVRNPVLSYDADPATGVQVYCSSYRLDRQWYVVGGTSIGAPQVADSFALVDQERAWQGLPRLTTPQARDAAQRIPASCYHTIPAGGPPMGLGSPQEDQWVPYMARYVLPWRPLR